MKLSSDNKVSVGKAAALLTSSDFLDSFREHVNLDMLGVKETLIEFIDDVGPETFEYVSKDNHRLIADPGSEAFPHSRLCSTFRINDSFFQLRLTQKDQIELTSVEMHMGSYVETQSNNNTVMNAYYTEKINAAASDYMNQIGKNNFLFDNFIASLSFCYPATSRFKDVCVVLDFNSNHLVLILQSKYTKEFRAKTLQVEGVQTQLMSVPIGTPIELILDGEKEA